MKILNACRAIAVVAVAGLLAIGWQRDVAFDPASSTVLAATIQEDEARRARCCPSLRGGLAVGAGAGARGPLYRAAARGPGVSLAVQDPWYGEHHSPRPRAVLRGALRIWRAHEPRRPSALERNPDGLATRRGDLDGRERRSAAGQGVLVGFTTPPGTPGFKFIETFTFLDGGTGRFEYAEGTGMGFIDPVAQTASTTAGSATARRRSDLERTSAGSGYRATAALTRIGSPALNRTRFVSSFQHPGADVCADAAADAARRTLWFAMAYCLISIPISQVEQFPHRMNMSFSARALCPGPAPTEAVT